VSSAISRSGQGDGRPIILLFEGRDAGKGGIIRRSPRVSARVSESLPARTVEREKTQLFMQRYISHFPAAGEIVVLDRSWYNRSSVEYVMKFCTEAEHRRFRMVPSARINGSSSRASY
jgi:polyphosphate kinase 2 (PPK2 family)